MSAIDCLEHDWLQDLESQQQQNLASVTTEETTKIESESESSTFSLVSTNDMVPESETETEATVNEERSENLLDSPTTLPQITTTTPQIRIRDTFETSLAVVVTPLAALDACAEQNTDSAIVKSSSISIHLQEVISSSATSSPQQPITSHNHMTSSTLETLHEESEIMTSQSCDVSLFSPVSDVDLNEYVIVDNVNTQNNSVCVQCTKLTDVKRSVSVRCKCVVTSPKQQQQQQQQQQKEKNSNLTLFEQTVAAFKSRISAANSTSTESLSPYSTPLTRRKSFKDSQNTRITSPLSSPLGCRRQMTSSPETVIEIEPMKKQHRREVIVGCKVKEGGNNRNDSNKPATTPLILSS